MWEEQVGWHTAVLPPVTLVNQVGHRPPKFGDHGLYLSQERDSNDHTMVDPSPEGRGQGEERRIYRYTYVKLGLGYREQIIKIRIPQKASFRIITHCTNSDTRIFLAEVGKVFILPPLTGGRPRKIVR